MPSPSAVVDPISDKSMAEFARMGKVYREQFPGFVKAANTADIFTDPGHNVTAFADPVDRRYPCHTAAATWVSAMYFQEKRAEYHPKIRERIEQRFNEFVDYFHIRGDYEKLCKRANELHSEQELPDSSYAYVWADDNGNKNRYMPMRSAMEVKAASEWLEKYRDRLPFTDRNTVAKKILEKAAATGARIENSEFLEKQAGQGICDPNEVYTALMQRAMLAKQAHVKKQIGTLAETVKSNSRLSLQPQQLLKIAEIMDDLDRRVLNLRGRYTETLKRPEDVVFSLTLTKAASDRAELCELTSGNIYEKSQFTKLSYEDIASLLGDDFAKEVCDGLEVNTEKMAEVAHTLPRPDAELLDHLMQECGLQPQLAKASSDHYGLTNEEIEKLAESYGAPIAEA